MAVTGAAVQRTRGTVNTMSNYDFSCNYDMKTRNYDLKFIMMTYGINSK